MKILVTGGCGFIGSNFILNQIGSTSNKILNIDKITYSGNIDNLTSIKNEKNYQFAQIDICNKKSISDLFTKFSPDIVVHFAAESHVDRSIDSPMPFIETNIVGTANLLEAATYYWKINQKREFKFIHISTDEVYGSLGETGFFTEKTPYNPKSPYSSSKASSDHLVRSWNHTYGLPTIITNCSNNYGPMQFPEKLIPLMIINCLNDKPLPVYGEGDNIRDWLYVSDHCRAIQKVINNGKIGETYNIGGNNEIKNIDIVTTICNILDDLNPKSQKSSYKDLITFVKDRPGHDYRYAIDSSKIQKALEWKPIESFETGIYKTIEWYIENQPWWRKIQKKHYNQERLGLKNT